MEVAPQPKAVYFFMCLCLPICTMGVLWFRLSKGIIKPGGKKEFIAAHGAHRPLEEKCTKQSGFDI